MNDRKEKYFCIIGSAGPDSANLKLVEQIAGLTKDLKGTETIRELNDLVDGYKRLVINL